MSDFSLYSPLNLHTVSAPLHPVRFQLGSVPMNRLLALVVSGVVVGGVAFVAVAQQDKSGPGVGAATATPQFDIPEEKKNPWTGLTANWTPEQFQFAVVADRTGGHRKGVFSRAVRQINLMQPEFVMSVGDLIEGSQNADVNRKQWDEFDGYARQFKMPFFYCPGNHDMQSLVKQEVWAERLGRKYYHFAYKNCLFVVLNDMDFEADDPKDPPKVSRRLRVGKRQREAVAAALKAYPDAPHTFLFVHHPVWAGRDLTDTGWTELEEVLKGRKYTFFCGHVHNYKKYVRNGANYYQLATTGGGSGLRGPEYGEFDQIGWVSVGTGGTPTLANIMLQGILKDDLLPFPTDELGGEPPVPTSPVTGVVKWRGKSVDSLLLTFTQVVEGDAKPITGTAKTALDGSFAVYAPRMGTGLKPGKYVVTASAAEPILVDPKATPREVAVPEKYKSATTSPWTVEVKADTTNRFELVIDVPVEKKD